MLNLKTGTEEQLTEQHGRGAGSCLVPGRQAHCVHVQERPPSNAQTLRPTTFEICVMDLENRDPSGFPVMKQLTSNYRV